MDVDTALAELRDMAKQCEWLMDEHERSELLERFAVVFSGLDSAMSRGHYLPEPWKRTALTGVLKERRRR